MSPLRFICMEVDLFVVPKALLYSALTEVATVKSKIVVAIIRFIVPNSHVE